MKESKHRRETHIEICTDFDSELTEFAGHSKRASCGSAAPIRGILKRSPTANRVESTSQSRAEDRLDACSASLWIQSDQRVTEQCTSGDIPDTPEWGDNRTSTNHSTPRYSPRMRYSPVSIEDMLADADYEGEIQQEEVSLKSEVQKVIETIKGEMREAERKRAIARMAILAETMGVVQSMKKPGKEMDQSLVVMETTNESGSETERPSIPSNQSSIKLAIEAFATSPQELSDLLSLVDSASTPRLTLLLRKSRVEGMYKQCQGGWRKIYGGKDAPGVVEVNMVKMGFEVRGGDLQQVGEKQMWKADAFTL